MIALPRGLAWWSRKLNVPTRSRPAMRVIVQTTPVCQRMKSGIMGRSALYYGMGFVRATRLLRERSDAAYNEPQRRRDAGASARIRRVESLHGRGSLALPTGRGAGGDRARHPGATLPRAGARSRSHPGPRARRRLVWLRGPHVAVDPPVGSNLPHGPEHAHRLPQHPGRVRRRIATDGAAGRLRAHQPSAHRLGVPAKQATQRHRPGPGRSARAADAGGAVTLPAPAVDAMTLLTDLRNVGPSKPLGYLPIETI